MGIRGGKLERAVNPAGQIGEFQKAFSRFAQDLFILCCFMISVET